MDTENGDESADNMGDIAAKESLPVQAAPSEPAAQSLTKEIQPVAGAQAPSSPSTQLAGAMNINNWFSAMHWNGNPFIFNINPRLYVGYNQQKERILAALAEKHKIILIIGPTGSGKTTTLKWLSTALPKSYDTLYIGKPPLRADDFVHIFSGKYKIPWYLRPFVPNIRSVYQIPDFLNKKLKGKHLVILYDEAHESEQDVLEWIRVLSDQVENTSLVLAGLPVFDDNLGRIETLRKRIALRVELLSLTKEEMRSMIESRIKSKGGEGSEFDSLIDTIYNLTGGFPREVLHVCDSIVEKVASAGVTTITPKLLDEERQKVPEPSLRVLDALTPTQREALELLTEPRTPGEIANRLDLSKYKSRQHAVRSMNNVLKLLMNAGFVERVRRDRAFVYQLKPQFKSLVIKR